MDGLPAILALSGAHLQFGGHQSSASSGRKEISDHGEDVEEADEECK